MRVGPSAAPLLLLAVLALGSVAGSELLDIESVPELRQLLQSVAAAPGGYGAVLSSAGDSSSSGGYGGAAAGRSLMQAAPGGYGAVLTAASDAGGYGGAAAEGRRLIQNAAAPGGYGAVLSSADGGYGGNARRLIQDPQLEPGATPVVQYHGAEASRSQARRASLLRRAGGSSAGLVLPAGKCYCRFDVDFSTWALAEEQCRDALYTRCQTEEGLPCEWLDKYYAPTHGPGHVLPHEHDIAAFVFEDCTPQPPCACAGITFDGSDAVAASVACCRDLRVACKTPYSGLDCPKVEAFCSDDAPTPVLSAWTAHVLRHAECGSYRGVPYQFITLQQLHTAATAPPATQAQQQQQQLPDEAALLKQALLKMEATLPGGGGNTAGGGSQQRRTIVALSAIAAGAVCVAVVAVVFAMQREEPLAPITSTAAPLRAADVYQALTRGRPPTVGALPASCPPGDAGQGALHRDASAGSCLSSAAICINALDSSRDGVREPLLQGCGLSRSVSNGSEASTGSTFC